MSVVDACWDFEQCPAYGRSSAFDGSVTGVAKKALKARASAFLVVNN